VIPSVPSGNLIASTLGRAFGAMWDMFWPVLGPLALLLVIAAAVYVIRSFTNVG
jgi:hypothetical protein